MIGRSEISDYVTSSLLELCRLFSLSFMHWDSKENEEVYKLYNTVILCVLYVSDNFNL